MKLGDQIFRLRKECKLSQEQLAEKIGVTRQTISNWELNETSPNPEQLKLLSQCLKVSVDVLLDNDIRDIVEEKVSNTEKLAGIVINILKIIGILLLVYLIIAIFSFVWFNRNSISVQQTKQSVYLNCTLNGEDYHYFFELDENGKIVQSNGSDYIQELIKEKDFSQGDRVVSYIESYFQDYGGYCM